MSLSSNYSRTNIIEVSYEIGAPENLKEWRFLDKISEEVGENESIAIDLLNSTN